MSSFRPLPKSFYARPAMVVAQDCLGKHLVFESAAGILSGRIVEAEAYLGVQDRAAHSFGGRRSRRNEVMYGPAGLAYVFLIYGLHHHLNLVTDRDGEPSAVLLRAVEPLAGEDIMQSRRKVRARTLLTNGPGKLCQAFGIGLGYNGHDLGHRPLFLTEGEPPKHIQRTPRIGVDYAGAWAKRLLRFVDSDSSFLSPASRVRK